MPRGKDYAEANMLTPQTIARRLGISVDKVHGWIRSGELRAFNLAARIGRRPRYRIAADDLADFTTRRQVLPAQQPTRRPRRRSTNVIEFF